MQIRSEKEIKEAYQLIKKVIKDINKQIEKDKDHPDLIYLACLERRRILFNGIMTAYEYILKKDKFIPGQSWLG